VLLAISTSLRRFTAVAATVLCAAWHLHTHLALSTLYEQLFFLLIAAAAASTAPIVVIIIISAVAHAAGAVLRHWLCTIVATSFCSTQRFLVKRYVQHTTYLRCVACTCWWQQGKVARKFARQRTQVYTERCPLLGAMRRYTRQHGELHTLASTVVRGAAS
jgi:hypothetical protein